MGKFDKEYATQWLLEHQYLEDNGIAPTFIKTTNGLTQWKYKKSARLFSVLLDFYEQVYHK